MSILKYSFTVQKPLREKVERLQQTMENVPQVDCPVRNYFCDGMYAREITIPKGTTLVGAVHKRENFAILSKGRISLVSDAEPREIHAPHLHIVQPGDKNVFLAHEDSVWTNFFATTETDLDKLIAELTESTADELLGGKSNKQLLKSGVETWHLDSRPAQSD